MSRVNRIEIAIGLILNAARSHIFLTQRSADRHQGNRWEFAGGKIEPGETAYQAMCRELSEEVGIEVQAASLFQSIDHDYGDKQLRLHFFMIETYQGEPYGKEGQPGQWVAITELTQYLFPEANQPVIEALITRFG